MKAFRYKFQLQECPGLKFRGWSLPHRDSDKLAVSFHYVEIMRVPIQAVMLYCIRLLYTQFTIYDTLKSLYFNFNLSLFSSPVTL